MSTEARISRVRITCIIAKYRRPSPRTDFSSKAPCRTKRPLVPHPSFPRVRDVARCRTACCTTTAARRLDAPAGVGQGPHAYVLQNLGALYAAFLCILFRRTASVERRLLPAGPAYLAHVKRAVHKLTFEEHDKHAEEERKRHEALHGNGTNGDDDLGVGEEEEPEDLLSLDPKEWKVSCWYLSMI